MVKKNVHFMEMMIFLDIWSKNKFFEDKKQFFPNDPKKTSLFWHIFKKQFLSNDSKNVNFIEMLIFLDIWSKNKFFEGKKKFFSKWFQKNVNFFEILIFFEIKKGFLLECWYFRICGQKMIFKRLFSRLYIWTKKDFFTQI